MSRITRCAHCIGGTVLGGTCIACGRETEPDRVTLLEALLSNATPEAESHIGPRQTVPAAVSFERARLWMRGEAAQ